MAIITSIKQQKNQNRVNVYLDGEFRFGIDLDNFVILNLKVGAKYTEKQIEEIIKKAEFQKTFDKILRFATVRPRSEKEFRDWLYRKKVPEVIWKDLFSQLKDLRLLGDESFAQWWVETRQGFSPKSRRVLYNELRIKGVEKEIIGKVLASTKIDEGKIARNLLVKRRIHWDGLDRTRREGKMMEYLMRKGFQFEIAKKAIGSYNTNEDDKI